MSNLDDLLSSYRGILSQEFSDKPLLTASDFKGELRTAGHLFVGCAIKWLAMGDRLEEQTLKSIESAGSIKGKSCAYFSEMLSDGLRSQDVKPHMRSFCTAYFGLGGAYGRDYFYVNVTERNRSSMIDVPDNNETFQETALFLEKRLAEFERGERDFPALNVRNDEHSLTESEQTQEGWLSAMSKITFEGQLSEKSRQENLKKFWALVDYSPEIGTKDVALVVVALGSKELPDGLLESVRNAIADFPIALAIESIFSDAHRLSAAGRLGEFLSSWHELDEPQARVLQDSFESLHFDQKATILATVREGIRQREGWAREWNRILSE